ncbi:putative reverse transcriptase domain-containing protein [Tanacetum coccineum]
MRIKIAKKRMSMLEEMLEELHLLLGLVLTRTSLTANLGNLVDKGVVGLARWFKKMEFVFRISNWATSSQVKFATCTLLDGALTWWNSHVHTVGIDEAYEMARNNEKKGYARSLPYCNKCKLHYDGLCTVRCGNCKKVGHMARDCKAAITTTTQRAPEGRIQRTYHCYEYWKNKTFQCGFGGGEANQDSNVVTGTFLLNNHYASILFESGADRSFISITFSALIDIVPTTLDVSYAVELAVWKKIHKSVDTILRGCTLNLKNHPFNIDLMPAELGSFDVIISMDWLSKYYVVIVCDEKVIRIPIVELTKKKRKNEVVEQSQGDRSEDRKNSRLNIISCTKTQKYIQRGCIDFLAQIIEKKTTDKSEEKRLKDVPSCGIFQKSFQKTFQDSHQPDKLNYKST